MGRNVWVAQTSVPAEWNNKPIKQPSKAPNAVVNCKNIA